MLKTDTQMNAKFLAAVIFKVRKEENISEKGIIFKMPNTEDLINCDSCRDIHLLSVSRTNIRENTIVQN